MTNCDVMQGAEKYEEIESIPPPLASSSAIGPNGIYLYVHSLKWSPLLRVSQPLAGIRCVIRRRFPRCLDCVALVVWWWWYHSMPIV
jgi:hypothetical protein